MKVSVIFGGISFEHEISIVSAIALKKVLGNDIAHFIFLDSTHRFWLIPSKNMKSSFFAKGEYKTQCKEIFPTFAGFYYTNTIFKTRKNIPIQTAYSLIHGADGEDGILSALFEFYKIPYIAPRVEACALSFNKTLTKLFCAERKIKALPYQVLYTHDFEFDKKLSDFTPNFPYPVIVKPARLGSSIGVSVVAEQKELAYAIESAFEYDECVVIEPFIHNIKEYNLAGCKVKNDNGEDEWIFSIIEEPQKGEFLDFEKKYLDFSRTQQILQADISENLRTKIEKNFTQIYENAFEGAIIRCDFFVIDDEVYLNEINPIPGSGANYLFKDFKNVLNSLSANLPHKKRIKISYAYIEKIQRAKGK
ncbi:D-alanine--D-alanine ligase [Helicobacter sp. 23-1048]